MFVDWISCYQEFPFDIPMVHNGAFADMDAQGDMRAYTFKYKKHEGSHESSINIRSDGRTLHLSGNVGKFNRKDNLFNYNLEETMIITNKILDRLGLPNFTAGERTYVPYKAKNGEVKDHVEYSGAKFTRLDLTDNYTLGSPTDLNDYCHFLATQKPTRQKVHSYDQANTVSFGGQGSRNISSKFYNKYAELIKHYDQKDKHIKNISKYCHENGLGRYEITLKSTFLHNHGMRFWGEVTHEKLELIYKEYSENIFKEVEIMDVDRLSKVHRATYYDYLNGVNVKQRMTNTTFYNHRAAILCMGVDIAMEVNVIQMKKPVKILQIQPLVMPDWYDLKIAC